MLKVGEVKEIYEMKGAGRSIRGIARELDVSRNTVRRYLNSPEAMRPRPRPLRGSELDPYAEHIDRRMAKGLENCRVLAREIRALGYQGSYSTVVQYVRPRRQHKHPKPPCGSRRRLVSRRRWTGAVCPTSAGRGSDAAFGYSS